MACPREFLAQFDDCVDMPVKRMFSVGLVKVLEPIRLGGDKSKRAKLSQFVLDGVKRKMRFQP